MSSLRRTRVGPFREGITLEAVQQAANEERALELLSPVDGCFAELPAVTATEREEQKFIRNGCQYKCNLQNGKYRVYSPGGAFLMLGQVEEGKMTTIKSFFEV
jgi:tRNA pseudouridine55 synthase